MSKENRELVKILEKLYKTDGIKNNKEEKKIIYYRDNEKDLIQKTKHKKIELTCV